MALEDHYERAYGPHYREAAPNFERCCKTVWSKLGGWTVPSQCAKPRGHGPDGAYCKSHDPAVVAARKAKADRAERERRLKNTLEWSGPRFARALLLIADGHNDPRTLARAALDGIEADLRASLAAKDGGDAKA